MHSALIAAQSLLYQKVTGAASPASVSVRHKDAREEERGDGDDEDEPAVDGVISLSIYAKLISIGQRLSFSSWHSSRSPVLCTSGQKCTSPESSKRVAPFNAYRPASLLRALKKHSGTHFFILSREVMVYSRGEAEHKLAIIYALKSRGLFEHRVNAAVIPWDDATPQSLVLAKARRLVFLHFQHSEVALARGTGFLS